MRQRLENVLVFNTENVDLSTATKLEFYLKQRNGTFLEYVPEIIDNTSFRVTIPYEDAMELSEGTAEVQLALTTEGGSKIASNVRNIRIKRLIKAGGYDG
jgi:hypothetical protein